MGVESPLRSPTALGYAHRSVDSNHIDTDYFVHPSAMVEDGARVGAGTKIWHHSHVRADSRIGAGCNLGLAVYVDAGVVIGDRCKIQNHVSLYRGVMLEEEVFVGPAVAFTNDLFPRAVSPDWEVVPTRVLTGASLGANATVVCGVTVGEWSLVGAGSVVTEDVSAHALVVGNPAHLKGWMCRCGALLARLGNPFPRECGSCHRSTGDITAT
jgi:UDP-2-acetamido-3-amino-2,3-dideoxy-glucuronate N-acetyltransferase